MTEREPKPSEKPITKQRPSEAIESIAKILCENTVGPGGFDGPLAQAFRWKALMMYLDQRDQEFALLVKQLNKAFEDVGKWTGMRRRTPEQSASTPQPCNCPGCDKPSNPERESMPRCDWCMAHCPLSTGVHTPEEHPGNADQPPAECWRYRYDMRAAREAGERRHPQVAILKLYPDAYDLEAVPVADCWAFTMPRPIESPPGFVELAGGVRHVKGL